MIDKEIKLCLDLTTAVKVMVLIGVLNEELALSLAVEAEGMEVIAIIVVVEPETEGIGLAVGHLALH
ncbi:hypothetical protein OA48_08395 [Klebsiella variicola]|nr:hypothetical protein OA48_08395 [Klebsiella variicola]PXM13368.1 hypothetical protein DMS97_00010 [Klebsiella variicola]PXM30711.1 hypothetical protein DMT04_00010 [Klebsiella variicola]